MSTARHTPIPSSPKAAANAATFNAPLSQLDTAVVAEEAARAAAVIAEAARATAREDTFISSVGSGGGWGSTLDGTASSGQKVVPVVSTTGAVAGMPVYVGLTSGTHEVGVVDTISAGVSVTLVTNLTSTYAIGAPISATPAEVADARGGYATLGDAMLVRHVGYDLDAKPSGDGTPGFPIDWRHNDAAGYLMHLNSGATMTGGALIGLGIGGPGSETPTACTGLLINNKSNGRGMLLTNASLVSSAEAYGFYGVQDSDLAPLVYLQQVRVDAAPLLVLGDDSGAAVAGQMLAEFYSVTGGRAGDHQIGRIYADTGRLDWYRDIRADGSKFIALAPDTVSSWQDQVHIDAKTIAWHTFTGGPSYYHWRIAASVTSLTIESAPTGLIDGDAYDLKAIQCERTAGANRLGFFGATPVVKPTGVAVSAAGVHAALVSLGLIAA